MYINIYNLRTSRLEPKPIPKQSYNKAFFMLYDDSDKITIREYGTGKTVKTYSKYKYFVLTEDFNALNEPNKIKPFTEEEPKINNAAAIDHQNEPSKEKKYVPIENKTDKRQLEYAKKYHSKFSEIKLRVSPDLKTEIQNRAKEKNLSVNEYLIQLVSLDLKMKGSEKNELA